MSTTPTPASSTATGIVITRATLAELDLVAPLFDAYRVFYAQPSDPARARAFIGERLQHGQSVVLLARDRAGRAAGFTQLYPLYSSVRTLKLWILNDLYVDAQARRGGVASALLAAAADFARDDGAARLELETAHDNHAAQALYRARGWTACDDSLRFQLALSPA